MLSKGSLSSSSGCLETDLPLASFRDFLYTIPGKNNYLLNQHVQLGFSWNYVQVWLNYVKTVKFAKRLVGRTPFFIMCVCIRVCMYVLCMYVCMYVCLYVLCVYVYVYVCMYYVCMYVCMYVCVYVLYILHFTLVSVVTGGYYFPYTDRKL